MSDPVPWSVDGERLKADPATLEGYGKNAATIGKNFQADISGPAMLIQGGGEDIEISRGAFPEGMRAQTLIQRNAGEMMEFLADGYKNCLAIASCALVLGDLLKNADLKGAAMANAVEWALVMPGAHKPDNLPSYIDGKTLNDSEKEKVPVEASFGDPEGEEVVKSVLIGNTYYTTYRTKAGTLRTVIKTPDGYTEIGYRKDGRTMIFMTTGDTKGNATTVSYGKDGVTKTGTTVRSVVNSNPTVAASVYYKDETNRRYDENGELLSTETTHIKTTTHNDGTVGRDYYTETTDDEDKTTVSGVRHVTRQPVATTAEDYVKLTDERVLQADKLYGDG